MIETIKTVTELANQLGETGVVAFSAIAQELASQGAEFNYWDAIVKTVTEVFLPVGLPLMAGLTAVRYIFFNED